MPLGPLHEFAVPAPHNIAFANGELALSVANPIATAAARETFYLARWMRFEAGTYVLKAVVDDAATWWFGLTASNTHMVLSNRESQGVVEASLFLPAGISRLDAVLQNLSTGASSCYIAFSLWKDGQPFYVSAAAAWLFDTAPIPDESLTAIEDPRLNMPVFSVLPNWGDGVVERLSWLTDVMASEGAIEQRRSVRRFPRRSFEASFLRKGPTRARIDSLLVAVGKSKLLVPLWHEQYRLPNGLQASDTYIQFPLKTLEFREFYPGDWALVSNGNPDDFDFLQIDSVNLTTDRIMLVDQPVRDWPAGTRVFPLRVAWLLDAPQLSNVTDRLATAQLRFELVDPEVNIIPSWGYCAPLFRFVPDRSSSIDLDYQRTVFEFDANSGPVHVTDPSDVAQPGTKFALKFFNREALFTFRSFIAAARGKAARFYVPTYTHDIEPVGDIVGDTFDALPMGFWQYMKHPQSARRLIGIAFKDGRPTIYRTIIGITPIGLIGPPYRVSGERFTLDSVLPTIARSEIARVMFVVPSRFDQDSFEIEHVTSDSAAVRASVVTRAVDGTGMPPIDCWVTSRPYAVESLDALNPSAEILGGVLFNLFPPEALDVESAILSGLLTNPLWIIVMDDEAMDVDGEITAGVLRIALIDYVMDDEAMDVDGEITAGVLRIALIGYVMDDEAMDVAATITSGTLV